jgi:general secretion pathway protein M
MAAAAQRRHARAVLALAEARSRAAAIDRLRRVGASAIPGSFQLFAGTLATDAGFTVARIEPQGMRQVNIVITAARAPALFGWASEIERRGLVVDRLSARANSDATVAAEISVRARGR